MLRVLWNEIQFLTKSNLLFWRFKFWLNRIAFSSEKQMNHFFRLLWDLKGWHNYIYRIIDAIYHFSCLWLANSALDKLLLRQLRNAFRAKSHTQSHTHHTFTRLPMQPHSACHQPVGMQHIGTWRAAAVAKVATNWRRIGHLLSPPCRSSSRSIISTLH